MRYSNRLERAITTAGKQHKNQFRKDLQKLPYITHLFSVAAHVSAHSADEDVVIAALLHDTVEDTPYTFEEMERAFGKRVRGIVESITEPEQTYSWEKRKEVYIKKLMSASEGALMIAAADKIHNLSSMLDQYEPDRYESFLRDFGGTPADRLFYYGEMVRVITEKLDNEIASELTHTFAAYTEFLKRAETFTS
jgi:(p)ppGpp synthase/HD superfamily hydrolase